MKSVNAPPSTESEIGYSRVAAVHSCVAYYMWRYAHDPTPWQAFSVTGGLRRDLDAKENPPDEAQDYLYEGHRVGPVPTPGGAAKSPLSSKAFRGTLIHAGLAAFYTGKDPELAIQDTWLAAQESLSGILMLPDSFRRAASTATRVLVLSDSLRRAGYTVLPGVTERSLWAPDPVYCQRVDVVVQDPDGGVWIVDHKTSERPVTFEARVCLGQYHGFAWLGKVNFGSRFRGVISHEINLHAGGAVLGERLLPITGFDATDPGGFARYVRGAYVRVERALVDRANGIAPPRAITPTACQPYGRSCGAFDSCFNAARVMPTPA